MAKRVSVIGAGKLHPVRDEQLVMQAETLGRLTAESGWELVCGGLAGVMEAAARGARKAGGKTIGILPGTDRNDANSWIEIPIATGIGQMRNLLVVLNGDVTVACGGGAGTLSEIGHALKAGRKVIGLGSWAQIDGVLSAESAEDAIVLIKNILDGEA